MEYLIVKASKKVAGNTAVLINNEKNGMVGETLVLDKGFMEVSLDVPTAETLQVNLRGTTAKKPRVITINV
jgi:hypothetical protein